MLAVSFIKSTNMSSQLDISNHCTICCFLDMNNHIIMDSIILYGLNQNILTAAVC